MMRVDRADERDSGWEAYQPRFRVNFYAGGSPWEVTTYDVLDADVLEAIAWAEREAGSTALYSVALVVDHPEEERGLVWLAGMDANDEAANPREERTLASMRARRGKNVVRLPDA